MSENKKTISIDKDLFTLGAKKGGKKNKTEKKKKDTPVVKPNKLRKDLLSKIKKHQQMEQLKNNSNNSQHEEKKNEFNDSLTYLHDLSKKHKQKKQKTKKNHHRNNSGGNNLVNIDLPENIFDSVKPSTEIQTNNHHQPQHHQPHHQPHHQQDITSSNIIYNNQLPESLRINTPISNNYPLQGGNITNKSIPIENPPSITITENPTDHINNNIEDSEIFEDNEIIEDNNVTFNDKIEKEYSINNIANNIILPNDNSVPYGCLKGGDKPTYRLWNNKTSKNNGYSKPERIKHKKFKQKKRKTRRTKYKLGKTKKNISILIKNNKTRRNVQIEMGKLKQKPITEVKKYLYEKNLLKIGSSAPNDVLRTMYEQAILSGDITNIGNGVLLHNFLNEKK